MEAKFKVGDPVGCLICIPLFERLPLKDRAVILSVMMPDERGEKLGSPIKYMVHYPSGMIDWINESVTRTPEAYPGVQPYKHFGHALGTREVEMTAEEIAELLR